MTTRASMRLQPRGVLALGLAALAVSCGRKPQQAAASAATRVLTVEGFKTPESVKYDAELDLYFVTNINGHPSVKDNNGFISRVRPDGSIESLEFVSGGRAGVVLHAPKGTAIVADTLWVVDIDALRGFNKRTAAPVATVDLGRPGAQFPNDVAVGPDGALYVTDTGIRIDSAWTFAHPGPERRTPASSWWRSGGRRSSPGNRARRHRPCWPRERVNGTAWRCWPTVASSHRAGPIPRWTSSRAARSSG